MHVSDGIGYLIFFLAIVVFETLLLVGYSAMSTQSDLSATKSLLALSFSSLCFVTLLYFNAMGIYGRVFFSLTVGVVILAVPRSMLGLKRLGVTKRKYNLTAAHFVAGISTALSVGLLIWKNCVSSILGIVSLACGWAAGFLIYSVVASVVFEVKQWPCEGSRHTDDR